MDSIIPYNYQNEELIKSRVKNFYNEFKISELLRKSNIFKFSGTSCFVVFKMFDLIEATCKYGLPRDYVLFDFWFAYPNIIKKVLACDLNVVCRLKVMYRVFY